MDITQRKVEIFFSFMYSISFAGKLKRYLGIITILAPK